jgi:hypothetical protein
VKKNFLDARAALTSAASDGSSLSDPFGYAFPAFGAALTTLGDPFDFQVVSATREDAGRFDELQIDLRQGPSWDSHAGAVPVLVGEIRQQPTPWPQLVEAIADLRIRAVFAFPLRVGHLGLGALCLSTADERGLELDEIEAAEALAGIAAHEILRRALARLHVPGFDPSETFSRREVHQATGMVVAQLELSAADALLVIRAHAYATARPVRQVAADIVARRIGFLDE